MIMLYVLTWLPSGLFAWYYYRVLLRAIKRWQLRSLFRRRQTLIAELVSQRSNLVRKLDTAAEVYRKEPK
jgi:hypothetical protein